MPLSSVLGAVAMLAAGMAMPSHQDPAPIVSPEVHSDHTVTFRLRSPNAQKVEMNIEGIGNFDLQKGAEGVWSYTSKPLAPDIYGYSFSVDGVSTLDPMNPQIKPNLIWVGNMVTVPGAPAEVWETQDVPRGEVHHHYYKSKVVGDQRDFLVYTPPGYAEVKAKLPVLYLLHGFSDTAVGWTEVGKANVILDNLLAKGKIKPMVVVMPLGYGVTDFATPARAAFGNRHMVDENYAKFQDALLGEVLPQVEKAYRVSTKREDRAIAGLSMGGAESLMTGLLHLDRFAYIGAFSAGGLPGDKPEDIFSPLTAEKAKGLRVFWMSCGTEDSLIDFQRDLAEWFKGRGIQVVTNETSGGHIWPLWRRNLAEFTQMIFK